MKENFSLSEKMKINDTNNISSFEELFISKDIPKDIRKIVDEETLGVSLSERRGIDILFGKYYQQIDCGKNRNLTKECNLLKRKI